MITDNYIKMCEKAEEIQEPWRNPFRSKFGDLFWKGKKYLMIPSACELCLVSNFIPEEEIYLPTQEQLQEMLNGERCMNDLRFEYKIEALLYYLSEFISIKKGRYNLSESNDSFKQLLLAFVMHEKYHKVWNSEKWEEE